MALGHGGTHLWSLFKIPRETLNAATTCPDHRTGTFPRGIAHIAVLDILEQEGIPIHAIAGAFHLALRFTSGHLSQTRKIAVHHQL
jgi:hypothetical protein